MNFEHCLRRGLILGGAALSLAALAPSARANVYATNIKLNGSLTNTLSAPGNSVQFSYILNEPASLGVTLNVLSGTNVVRVINLPGNSFGTARGWNAITWDGKDNSGNTVGIGAYSVSITAASSGYTNWTQLTDDLSTYVNDGYGIAVDQNRTSPYYGRVLVVNSSVGDNPDKTAGDRVGVLKFNADSSPADEGITSSGDFPWNDPQVSPRKIEVSADDYVYVSIDDLSGQGDVYSWDPTLSPSSQLYVLRGDNKPGSASLAGPFVQGAGTNTQIWMADANYPSQGVLKWAVATNGACASNDLGMTIIGIDRTNLNYFASDVALDKNGNIYACQPATDASSRVFRFPAYDPSTNGGSPEVVATWAVGGGDDTYGQASGIAVDPTGIYVAASFEGVFNLLGWTNGNTKILSATNGALVANLDLGVAMQGITQHRDRDCAWDAAGNVYYLDQWFSCWRAVSPPGTNQSTTIAAATLQIAAATPPRITGISLSPDGASVTITFTALASDSESAFTVLSSSAVAGPYSPAGAIVGAVGGGVFQAFVSTAGPVQFYRIQR